MRIAEIQKLNKIIYYTSKYSMSILFIMFFIMTLMYGNKAPGSIEINKALSGRLYLTNKAMQNYGVTLFGSHIKWIGLNSVYSGIATKELCRLFIYENNVWVWDYRNINAYNWIFKII